MRDLLIECVQCGNDFPFTTDEQKHCQEMGFDEPKRCPDCRRHKTKSNGTSKTNMFRDKKKHFRLKYGGT
jgi:hypothetical protein